MKRYWVYLKSVLRHKKFVYLEGRKLGLSRWRLFWHDWDKFLPDEFMDYAKAFYTPDGQSRYEERHLEWAWMNHQHRNKHHWQYWVRLDDLYVRNDLILIWDRGDITAFARDSDGAFYSQSYSSLPKELIFPDPMPDLDRREMLADWRGAGLAYGNPDTKSWYLTRRDTIFQKFIHPDTLEWLDVQLGV